jgi:cupin superfamily acireductone dioxygenase involved in methionine salvage
MVKFTLETQRAICATADYVAGDAAEIGVTSKAGLAELVLDAGRMRTNGYPAADTEVDALIKAHGWKAVKTAAARIL